MNATSTLVTSGAGRLARQQAVAASTFTTSKARQQAAAINAMATPEAARQASASYAHSPLSRRPHRLLVCPECGGRLRKDKHPVMAETGTALRKRLCSRCGCAVHSRQLAEEITIVEPPQ